MQKKKSENVVSEKSQGFGQSPLKRNYRFSWSTSSLLELEKTEDFSSLTFCIWRRSWSFVPSGGLGSSWEILEQVVRHLMNHETVGFSVKWLLYHEVLKWWCYLLFFSFFQVETIWRDFFFWEGQKYFVQVCKFQVVRVAAYVAKNGLNSSFGVSAYRRRQLSKKSPQESYRPHTGQITYGISENTKITHCSDGTIFPWNWNTFKQRKHYKHGIVIDFAQCTLASSWQLCEMI